MDHLLHYKLHNRFRNYRIFVFHNCIYKDLLHLLIFNLNVLGLIFQILLVIIHIYIIYDIIFYKNNEISLRIILCLIDEKECNIIFRCHLYYFINTPMLTITHSLCSEYCITTTVLFIKIYV